MSLMFTSRGALTESAARLRQGGWHRACRPWASGSSAFVTGRPVFDR